MSDLPAILRLKYDFSGNELLSGFSDVELQPFAQDTQDWNDPATGEFYKATFDYFAFLRATRKSDGVNFCIQVRMDHRMIDRERGTILEAYVKSVFLNAVLGLHSYATCDCFVEFHCARHSR